MQFVLEFQQKKAIWLPGSDMPLPESSKVFWKVGPGNREYCMQCQEQQGCDLAKNWL